MDEEIGVAKRIARTITENDGTKPLFYALGGDRMTGYPTPIDDGGDIDVRGMHVSPQSDFYSVGGYNPATIINQGVTTQGYEEVSEYDVVSVEVLDYVSRLRDGNFSVVEPFVCGPGVLNTSSEAIADLRSILSDHDFPGTGRSYYGMASGMHTDLIEGDDKESTHDGKRALYSIRAYLAYEYLSERGDIMANLNNLIDYHEKNTEDEHHNFDLINQLIEAKESREHPMMSDADRNRAIRYLNTLQDNSARPSENDDIEDPGGAFEDELDEWLFQFYSQVHSK